jgi:hypothetical protein
MLLQFVKYIGSVNISSKCYILYVFIICHIYVFRRLHVWENL